MRIKIFKNERHLLWVPVPSANPLHVVPKEKTPPAGEDRFWGQ